MKKIIIQSLIGLFCFVAFFRGTLPQTQNKIISDQIIASFFLIKDKYFKAENFPDTNIKFTGIMPGNNNSTSNYASAYCGQSPAYLYYMLYMKFDPEAYWNHSACTYDEKMLNEFKKISGGKNIIKNRLNTAVGELRLYDSQAILAAFNSVYRKPTDKFYDLSLQKVYDVTVKNFMQESADAVAKVMAKKSEFEKLSNEYLTKAKTDSTFDGGSFSAEISAKFIVSDTKDFPCLDGYEIRIVSMMLRRQIDGSLPTILSCMKTIIKDYDPTYYSKISSKF